MAYKTVRADRQVQKFVHLFLHLVAIVLGIVGLHAAFKFHDRRGITDMYSLHSWIGISTFSLYCLQVHILISSHFSSLIFRRLIRVWMNDQWLLGLIVFLPPGGSVEMKTRVAPLHVSCGRALLFMAICTALTGLMEKSTFLELKHHNEARVINFLGLMILLFGIAVDLSVTLGRYIWTFSLLGGVIIFL